MLLRTVRRSALAMLLVGACMSGIACDDESSDGTGGTAGTAGSGGSAGSAGATGGSAGSTSGGSAGSTSGGSAGTAGSAGTGGSAGTAGSAGTGGSAGSTDGGAGSATDGSADARDGAAGSTSYGSADATDSASDADAQALTDADILSIAETANTGEVQMAAPEQSRGIYADIKAFAAMMASEHNTALTRETALGTAQSITPRDNAISVSLRTTAMTVVDQLNGQTGAAVDRAYIASQVTVHQTVLSLITDRLLPAATNAALRTELMSMQTSVTAHLARAQMLQSALADGGLEAGTTDGGADAGDASAE
jgi:predicted outer membrane protein